MKLSPKSKAVKYAAGIAGIILLVCLVDVRSLRDAFEAIGIGDIALLAILSFFLIAVSVFKWRLFLEQLGIRAGFWRLFALYLVGYFVNLLMPSYLGGDLVRSLYVGAKADRAHALSATILERYTGLVAMLVIASICVWFAPNVTIQIRLVVIAASIGLGVVSVLVYRGMLERIAVMVRCPGRIIDGIRKVQRGLGDGIADRNLLIKASAASFAFHVLTIVNTAAVAHAVGWTDVPWSDLFVVVPLILLVGAVPISPQGLGIQEGAFLFFLHGVGATPAQALSIGLVLRAKSYILALIGGFLWLGVRRRDSAA